MCLQTFSVRVFLDRAAAAIRVHDPAQKDKLAEFVQGMLPDDPEALLKV